MPAWMTRALQRSCARQKKRISTCCAYGAAGYTTGKFSIACATSWAFCSGTILCSAAPAIPIIWKPSAWNAKGKWNFKPGGYATILAWRYSAATTKTTRFSIGKPTRVGASIPGWTSNMACCWPIAARAKPCGAIARKFPIGTARPMVARARAKRLKATCITGASA